jgi:hypothetical protein
MTRSVVMGGVLGLALAAAGCVYGRAVFQPGPWDMESGSGPLKVYGAAPDEPGPTIFRALEDEPPIRKFLAREGEPDTLEVLGARLAPKQILLKYTRPSAGPPRSVLLDPTSEGYVARAPEPLATVAPAPRATPRTRRPARPRPTASPEAGAPTEPPAARKAPTAVQLLECPIDPDLSECRAFCVPGATYEWCR